tara:strand:+ start:3024 stop:3680 length:657 start_codon:yes stop_codon:yes gene_type:complete
MNIEFQCTDSVLSNEEVVNVLNKVQDHNFVKKIACLPPYVKYIKNHFKDRYIISSIIDFPLGVLQTSHKLEVIKQSINDGCKSIEIVTPSFLINNKQTAKIKTDIEKCYDLCSNNSVSLHYILEYRAYNYACLYRLIKNIIKFDLNNIYISTGNKLDDIVDHLIALAMIQKEIPEVKVIPNANIYNDNHLNLLEKNKITHFRVNNTQILTNISQKYRI